jgi:hypothetical protein
MASGEQSTAFALSEDDGTDDLQTIDHSLGEMFPVSKGAWRYVVTLRSGNSASASVDSAYWIELSFTDVGPRNF